MTGLHLKLLPSCHISAAVTDLALKELILTYTKLTHSFFLFFFYHNAQIVASAKYTVIEIIVSFRVSPMQGALCLILYYL